MSYGRHYNIRRTPQSQPIPGADQVANNGGGFAWAIDDWGRLDRFTILGSLGGTYYVNEQKLTVENAEAVRRCIAEDGKRVVARTVEISREGRAHKNDPALFVLAMCVGFGDDKTRSAVYTALPSVARIGTHLFHFLEFVKGFKGWSRGLRTSVRNWYDGREINSLAYQLVKYQQRDGWSHRDVFRLVHPKADGGRGELYAWVMGKGVPKDGFANGYEQAKAATTKQEIVSLIETYGLTREMIPTQWLREVDVWDALLEKMPLGAMVRNLGKMTSVGLVKPMSNAASKVIERLSDAEYIRRSRLHPLSILVALKVYGRSRGIKGSLSWHPVPQVLDALDTAFYKSFKNVRPTGKRLMLALDVSPSMGVSLNKLPLTARGAAAAMALVTANVESRYAITAFSSRLVSLPISTHQRLDDVERMANRVSWGSTDCALPMLQAVEEKIEVDAFIVYTDNETNTGYIHPSQALDQYRQKMGIPAKLIVVAMTSAGFSIADPNDLGALDVVGFDTATPNVISEFVRG